jgi:peptide/nickel transport system permease protein
MLTTLGMAIFAPLLARFDPFAFAAVPLSPPSFAHPMGTDAIGRDLYSGVLYGARASLAVAGTSTMLAALVGTVIGLAAGYRGGMPDDLLMRFTELVQTLPRFFLVVVVVALFGPGLNREVAVIAITAWPTLARVVRGETLAIRDVEFIVSARASGASTSRVMWRHILPNITPSALVIIGLLFGQALLVEASVGFLGLADPTSGSWGALAGQAQGFLRAAWWLSVFPGLAIAAAVLGANLLADAFVGAARR